MKKKAVDEFRKKQFKAIIQKELANLAHSNKRMKINMVVEQIKAEFISKLIRSRI